MKIPPHKRIKPEDVNMTPIYLTSEGIERLREKLARLKARLPALAEETARTAAFGDRSDNAEYKAAKGALRYATFESYRIEDQLKRVVLIERGAYDDGVVRLGSTVTIMEVGHTTGGVGGAGGVTGGEKKYEILGPDETNPTKGRISYLSPLGAALMGKKKGDVLAIEATGRKKKYRVVKVQ